MSQQSFSSIPAAAAERFTVSTGDGVSLAAYRLHAAPPSGRALLWGHANGFAAGSYLPLLAELTGMAQIFAFDARGHGGSTTPPAPFERTLHIDRFTHDLAAVAAAVRGRIGDAALYFASHSFSGVAALRLGSLYGDAPWAGITLFDPPLFPTPDQPAHARAIAMNRTMLARTARRRRHWANPDIYAAALATRGPFLRCRAEMLAAHARATLCPNGGGGFALCCLPEVEIGIYNAVLNPTTFAALDDFPRPVHMVGADPASEIGQSWAGEVQAAAVARLPKGQLTVVPDTSHLLVLEEPEICRDILLDMLRAS